MSLSFTVKVPFLTVNAGLDFVLAGAFVREGAKSSDFLPFGSLNGIVVISKAFAILVKRISYPKILQ